MKTVFAVLFATIVTTPILDASQQKVHVYELSERNGEVPHVKLLNDNDLNDQLNEDTIDQLLQQINKQKLRGMTIKANKNNMKRKRKDVIKPAYISQFNQNNQDYRENSELSSNKQRDNYQFISWKNPFSKSRSTRSKNQKDNRFLELDSLLVNQNNQGSIWDNSYKYRSGPQSKNQKDSNVIDLYDLFYKQDSLENWDSNKNKNKKDNTATDLSNLLNKRNSEIIWDNNRNNWYDNKLSNRGNQNSKRGSRFISLNDQYSFWDRPLYKKDRKSKNQDGQRSNRGRSNWYNRNINWDDQYNKAQQDNNWHDEISNYINRQIQQNYERNQKRDKNYQRVRYGDDLENFFGEDGQQRNAALLSDLLGSSKRDKREAERQITIKRIKKLVTKLKQLDDDNEARLEGTVYATKGDLNKNIDERSGFIDLNSKYNIENNQNAVPLLGLRSGRADENDDLDNLIEDRTMPPPREKDIFTEDF